MAGDVRIRLVSAPMSMGLRRDEDYLGTLTCYPQARALDPSSATKTSYRPLAPGPVQGSRPKSPWNTCAPRHTPLAPQISGDLRTRWGGDFLRREVRKRWLFHFIQAEVQPLDCLQPGPLDPGAWGQTHTLGRKKGISHASNPTPVPRVPATYSGAGACPSGRWWPAASSWHCPFGILKVHLECKE